MSYITPTLRELKEAEKAWARATITYGPNNMETIRKEIRYRELKEQREKSRQAYLNQYEAEV